MTNAHSSADRKFIESKYTPEPNTGCWLWTGYIRDTGYGGFERENKAILAHRFVYEALVGAIPAGLHLDHLCRVRCCVNPAHLEPVTAAVNNQRAVPFRPIKAICVNGHSKVPGSNCDMCLKAGRRKHKAAIKAARHARGLRHNASKTHCVRGHEFTPENTATLKSGHRHCYTCRRMHAKATSLKRYGRRAT